MADIDAAAAANAATGSSDAPSACSAAPLSPPVPLPPVYASVAGAAPLRWAILGTGKIAEDFANGPRAAPLTHTCAQAQMRLGCVGAAELLGSRLASLTP